MNDTQQLMLACAALAMLTFVVGARMFYVRIRDMRQKRIDPQSVSLSAAKSEMYDDSRASDNYNHLFELPLLFYVLCGLAIASSHVPAWLPAAAWVFVALRVVHSAIQCTYNKVVHRFIVFQCGFVLLAIMWCAFVAGFMFGEAG